MASKQTVSSVTITRIGGTEVTISDNAGNAWNDFMHGLPVVDDDGKYYPISAILTVEPAWEEKSVDMTDSFCGEE